MKFKPILFNTEMVRAILEGRKTQTRRIIKPQPTNPRWNNVGWLGWDDGHGYCMKPPCMVGDVLWVRETFDNVAMGHPWYYKADGDLRPECWKGERWMPSIHMPKEAARIFLKVKGVRVKRLQDITPEEVEAEGTDMDAWYKHDEWQHRVGDGFVADEIMVVFETLCGFFGHRVWDNTMQSLEQYEKYGWDANPWVWVIEFERCEKPEWWCREAVLGP